MNKQSLIKIINQLSEKNLTIDQFDLIDEALYYVSEEVKMGRLTRKDIADINSSFGVEFMDNTIQGYGVKKPYGYSGDFLMIDKIYTFHRSEEPKYKIWDDYFHLQSAPKAVRNRKDYFKRELFDKFDHQKKFDLLNVASGPARDLYEAYEKLNGNHKNLLTTCVEMDQNAIDHAKKLNEKYIEYINFEHKNIFRFQPKGKFDMIWSSGLFDYFNDRAFILMLQNFKEWTRPNGEIIIGNFNDDYNPSRDYMEIFGEWYLYHRTEEQLLELARKSGFDAKQISVGKEIENVNLFLHIKMI
ncbi:MAG: class I SAM-dependent methyltransferase [Bacteroidales bacterium]|jgi:extracellular factor (EF) 3-hydroxypalmitic acid methyl ester biosynthesis protein|nr:class I SAM-dependent methyltransferase [Bacteroidales bacterium]